LSVAHLRHRGAPVAELDIGKISVEFLAPEDGVLECAWYACRCRSGGGPISARDRESYDFIARARYGDTPSER